MAEIASEALVKNPNEIHYVFLEGSAGVGKKVFIASGTELPLAGKTTLTSKLQKMGHGAPRRVRRTLQNLSADIDSDDAQVVPVPDHCH